MMTIRFGKKRDGTHVLACVRADGTATWQRGPGTFFPLHDLGHYAIETTLALRLGFFGLLASGWEIDDFGNSWPRGPIPDEAIEDASIAEWLAGSFDLERYAQYRVGAEEFNRMLAEALAPGGRVLKRPVTEEELQRIRTALAELVARWQALPPGETLELPFPGDPNADRGPAARAESPR